jgi:hypothetical protein
VQAHPDAAVAEERVPLGVGQPGLGVLVGPEVERADDQRLAVQPPEGVGVRVVVVLLARLLVPLRYWNSVGTKPDPKAP